MIVSHKHNFIFIHGRKTAGSSIGISLMRYLGSGDIVRGYITGGVKNDIFPPDWKKSILYTRPFDFKYEDWRIRAYRRFVKNMYSVNSTHLSASEIREIVGEEVWNSYYKFTFIRNPYDRIVSFYYWRVSNRKKPPTFYKFVEALLSNNSTWLKNNNLDKFSNWQLYTINDEVSIDFIGCFDRLNKDLNHISNEIGISFDGWLPHNKSGIKPKKTSIDKLLDTKLKSLLRELLYKEFDLYDSVK